MPAEYQLETHTGHHAGSLLRTLGVAGTDSLLWGRARLQPGRQPGVGFYPKVDWRRFTLNSHACRQDSAPCRLSDREGQVPRTGCPHLALISCLTGLSLGPPISSGASERERALEKHTSPPPVTSSRTRHCSPFAACRWLESSRRGSPRSAGGRTLLTSGRGPIGGHLRVSSAHSLTRGTRVWCR